ncbi:MAG TPA: hypothetical protein VGG62_14940 [Terracidiphilus sp.]|jgi:hypothetical protein
MSMHPIYFLVTARLDSPLEPVPGSSLTERCARCEELIVLSPRSQDLMARYPERLVAVCLECFGGAPEGNPV